MYVERQREEECMQKYRVCVCREGSRTEGRLRTEGRPFLRSIPIVIEFQHFSDGRLPITNLLYRRSLVRGRKVASFYYNIP